LRGVSNVIRFIWWQKGEKQLHLPAPQRQCTSVSGAERD
jgi:hypothetical protein